MPPSIVMKSTGVELSNTRPDQREDLIGEIFDCLYGLSNITGEMFREIEKLTGLNKNQALAIKTISLSLSIHASELAKSLYINPVTMLRILDHLEKKGLIARVRSITDRRVVEIWLTDKAKDIVIVLQKITHNNLMNYLSTTENNKLMNMLDALQRLFSLLDAAYPRKP